MVSNDDPASPPQPRPRGPQWPVVLAATGAAAAGVLAAHSTAWATGIGTAVALFLAAHQTIRR